MNLVQQPFRLAGPLLNFTFRFFFLSISPLQDKQRGDLERAHIECEKVRDKYEKLVIDAERAQKLGHSPNAISPGPLQQQQPTTIPPQTAADRTENERLRDRLEKALQVNQLLYNFLEKHTQNQFQTRDATELEAGRLAKELEKAQMHLAKQQETNESTRIEFERMSAELNRFQERADRAEQEKEALRQQIRLNNPQSKQFEQAMMKMDQDSKKLAAERYDSLNFWCRVHSRGLSPPPLLRIKF